ncbi:MAG: ABC transporter substrate-binding protein [Deltaproteobacteria bacterium]|jgi:putative ABC transport system substrate-binding protein|nr:ABC transporter substrate-binding protein [Deltaproteobacteria bacterium]
MRALRLFLALLAAVAIMGGQNLFAYKISINQFVEHPSLDQTVQGFKDALKDGKVSDVEYSMHNAQAKTDTAAQIVHQIIGEKPDLVLAVATSSAIPTVNAIKDTPILFTAVTDPVEAKLVASLESPGANVTGTSDINPVADQIALIKEVQPTLKNLGIIYNSGEPNSVVQVGLAKAKAEELGIKLVEAVTVNTAGVNQAAQSLVGKVDAIYLPTDNSVISSLEAVLKVALDQKIPVYPAEDDSIRKGGVAVLSISYYQLGRQTGDMAVKILKGGVKPAAIPVETQNGSRLVVNQGFADKIGLKIPASVLDRADETLK